MKIIELSIRRRVTIAMFTLAIILFGSVSFLRLKINLLPELTYPSLTVRTEYVGAAPAEIENLISKPIEEALGVVKNVHRVSSISRSGQSDVLLEFSWGTNMDYASLDVREKLDALELPLDVQRPSILRFDPSLEPIMRFGFYRTAGAAADTQAVQPGFDEEELKFLRRFAEEEIKKELEAALGVAAVKVSGGLEDEIQVLVDQGRLAQLDLPIDQLAGQIGAENVNLSGGRLEEGMQQYLVRTLNQFQSISEISDVIVSTKDGKPTYLRDIATVRHGYKEREAITRLDGREAVEIAIYKEGDANTVSVAREVDRKLVRVREILPPEYELTKVYDQSTFITQSVNEVIQAGVIGGVLAILVLYFFLQNFWATVIISLSIPISVIATFNLMYGANLTLNIMSLGGIALGIGMLVDNSIVVLENISRHREQGKNVIDAAREGASEVGRAVTASTLTTIAVFLPLVFVKGISGQLFRDQALTVTFALLASLFVALTLIPMLASLQNRKTVPPVIPAQEPPKTRAGRAARKTNRFIFTSVPVLGVRMILGAVRLAARGALFCVRPFLRLFQRAYTGLEKRYHGMLTWSLAHRGGVIFIAAVLFAASVLLVPKLGVELIPQLSQGEFHVEFRLPPGTPLDITDRTIATVQNSAKGIENISTTFAVAGTGNRMDANPEQGGENWGELNVVLTRGSGREQEEQVMGAIRKNMEDIPDLQYKFARPTLFSMRTPVEIEVSGFELRHLKTVSSEIVRKLEASPRFADVKSTMRAGHPEIQIRFDRERAATLGFAVHQIADRVVNKIRGDVATRYSWHDRKIDVLVRARETDRNSIEKIRKLIINPESERPVTLDAVADIVIDTGPGEIRRIDQERVALVTANLSHGDLGSAADEIEAIIGTIPMPSGITVQLAGQNREMMLSFRSLVFALLLAIFLVYLVMASQFESFLHPFVILFTIPLALIGAVLGLLVTGSTISVVVFIGLILLAGIVVNNAIVLVDFINQLRARGMGKIEAIIEGGRSRLRPILMTMLTTTLGLLPLALGIGEGAEVRAPMAITVIGGLTVSTLLTLIVIPVVYAIVDRKD
ncbi:MAG TPA: efflux RND transporter permease subunit [Patescibacteria group bacterium]|nr:efflux RND transporter permease subunit [Patescibacteria group bacterium]